MNPDETLGVAEAAMLMRAENETVMLLARRGDLPGTRVGKSWVFLRDDVIAFLRGRIDAETEERRQHFSKTPLAIAMERPENPRRTPLPVLPVLPGSRD